jgi:Glycosyl transferase family 2
MSVSLHLSIVVPSRDSVSSLRSVLAAIRATELPPDKYELIVVDDASTDGSPTVAARFADKIIRLTGMPVGPAYARNRGAELAQGEIVAFVNPDVLVEPNTLPAMLSILAENSGIDAVSASREDSPDANFVSQYWNLLLRFGEQRHSGAVGDLASGCSAMRRSVLMSAGMYDEWRFGSGCLEGLELGQRLHRGAHGVLVSRNIQVMHLKEWSVRSVCREVWSRSRMLTRSLGYQSTRAVVPSEVVITLTRAMPPVFAAVSVIALSGAFLPEPSWQAKATIAMVGILVANLPVYRYYAEMRGLAFAICAAPLHFVTQSLAAIALLSGWVLRNTVGDRSPDAATQAYAEVGVEKWPPVPRRRS